MTKQEIYKSEQSNDKDIVLYPEGKFYKAYERSAWRLCMFVHEFKVSCRWVGTAGAYIVNVGFPVDPTEGDIWEMRYFFERDGEELDAIPGDLTPFYAVKKGRRVGMKKLLADGWVLLNDAGIEIDYEQAAEISRILKEHRK